jgi:threonine synthase
MSYLQQLQCSLSDEFYPADRVQQLSPAGRPLLCRYDLARMRSEVDRDVFATRAGGFWCYEELLPCQDYAAVPRLGEIKTPLIPVRHARMRLTVKDEGRLPTGSFKARGLALAVARARELGLNKLAMPSNGNAGAALAAYASRCGMRSLVVCPADNTPQMNIDEIRLQGAELELLDGMIDDCGKRVRELIAGSDWFDVSTLKEPYRLEGKKTMGLELAEQYGWKLPDVIVYPTGGGTGLIGMWKAFQELITLGWLEQSQLPRMVAVQATGCAPIVRAFDEGAEEATRWEHADTLAAGIRVPAAVGDRLMLQTLRDSAGTAIAVSDDDIVAAWKQLARDEGLLLCPEGAATLAAAQQLSASGWIEPGADVLLFNCATGLKYPLPD